MGFSCLESFIDIETDGGRKLVYILVYLYITHSNINKYLFSDGPTGQTLSSLGTSSRLQR